MLGSLIWLTVTPKWNKIIINVIELRSRRGYFECLWFWEVKVPLIFPIDSVILYDSHLKHVYSLDQHETLPVESSVHKINNCVRKISRSLLEKQLVV